MSSLLIPFARTSSGEIVQPSKTLAGSALTCPGCEGEVRFRQRHGARDHFFHLHRPDVLRSCGETAIHKAAKAIVAELDTLPLKGLTVSNPLTGEPRTVRKPSTFAVKEGVCEFCFPDRERQVDVRLTGTDATDSALGDTLVVEVCVSNPVLADRARWFQEQGIPCIEIELHGLGDMPSLDDVRKAVLEVGRQRWIHHPARQAKIEELRESTERAFNEIAVDAELDSEHEELQGWLEAELPRAMAVAREDYWFRYQRRLHVHSPELVEALEYCPTGRYERIAKRYGEFSYAMADRIDIPFPAKIVGTLAELTPFIVADSKGLEFAADRVARELPDDLPRFGAAELLWLLKEKVPVEKIVPHLITTGEICLNNAPSEGGRTPLTKISMFNNAQRRHDEWLLDYAPGREHYYRVLYCKKCRQAQKTRIPFGLHAPTEIRCRCGAMIPVQL